MTVIEAKRLRISVIIPAKNEELYVGRTIEALYWERKRHNLIDDIILVDNGSEDRTVAIAEQLQCTVFHAEGTVGNARNIGAQHTSGNYLAFVDADVVVSDGWSTNIRRIGYDDQRQQVRPNILTGSTCDIPADARWLEKAWFGTLDTRKEHQYINSGNLIIERHLFEQIGGFDETLESGEDVDLCRRAELKGGRLIFDRQVHAVHLGYPKSVLGFFRREVWHGREMVQNLAAPHRDKALLLALFHLCFLLFVIIGGFASLPIAALLFVVYPLVPLTLACIRLKKWDYPRSLQVALLISVYGFARAWSLVSTLAKILFRSKAGI